MRARTIDFARSSSDSVEDTIFDFQLGGATVGHRVYELSECPGQPEFLPIARRNDLSRLFRCS
ncbi:hypothetical protein, partial [Rhizobium leguminosarum]|uniref:hypothetical protein n=1 Tax=Rhizobium leguminosarum TaxID=384 RepID=UPI001C985505